MGSAEADVVTPSSWLKNCDLDIVEIINENENEVVSMLLRCEIILAVIDPYISPDETLKYLLPVLRNDLLPSIIVVNGPTVLSVAGQRDRSAHPVCADAAISANTAFLDNSSAAAIDAYQERFKASGIGELQVAIQRISLSLNRQRVALRTAILALQSMDTTLESDIAANEETRQMANELRESAQEAASQPRTGVKSDDLAQARLRLETLFQSRWSWLSLVARLRIDDCGREVAEIIQELFGRSMEHQVGIGYNDGELNEYQIAFENGRSKQLQSDWEAQTQQRVDRFLRSERKASTSSANTLATVLQTSVIDEPRTPSAMIVQQRRQQLLETVVPSLQRSAERAALVMCGLGTSGFASAWSLYTVEIIGASTATGLGIVATLLSIRLGQRLWGRAQTRFWREWERLTTLLQSELEVGSQAHGLR